MKKTIIFSIFILLFSGLFLTSCENDDMGLQPKNEKTDVTFGINHVTDLLKSDAMDIECNGDEAVSAEIIIDGFNDPFTPSLIDGGTLTQAIKLNSGVYTVTSFKLLDAQGNVVKATPADGSDFAVYVSETVPFQLEVPEFDKVERNIEVLCFNEADYTSFGFNWFNIGQVEVNQLLFFGDLCYFPELYVGSLYDQTFTLSSYPFDIIALFEIRTFVDNNGQWESLKVFSNVDNPNAPLAAEWFTHSSGVVDFKFELWVMVYTGMNQFDWVLFDEFLFDSENPLVAETNNVVDFVIGNCVYTPAQFEYDPFEPIEFVQSCPVDVISDNILTLFPEQENAITAWPTLFDANNQLSVITGSVNGVDTDVWVEYIFEGAGWVNTFGYYTYEVGQKPSDPSQLTKTVIWPQVSDINEGGPLAPGELFQIGQLPENTVVGFYIVAQGWDGTEMVPGVYTHYTDFEWNENETQQHTLFIESGCNSLVLTFEDIKLPSGDKDFNDIIIKINDNDSGFVNQPNSFDLTNVVILQI